MILSHDHRVIFRKAVEAAGASLKLAFSQIAALAISSRRGRPRHGQKASYRQNLEGLPKEEVTSQVSSATARLPRGTRRALAALEEQEKVYSSRGKLAEYAKKLIEELPDLIDRPRVLDRALKLIIRSGLRRSALNSIEAMEFEGKRGVAAYIASYLPGEQELNQRTGDFKRKRRPIPKNSGAKSARSNQPMAG